MLAEYRVRVDTGGQQSKVVSVARSKVMGWVRFFSYACPPDETRKSKLVVGLLFKVITELRGD